jgi:hypothetical protein
MLNDKADRMVGITQDEIKRRTRKNQEKTKYADQYNKIQVFPLFRLFRVRFLLQIKENI